MGVRPPSDIAPAATPAAPGGIEAAITACQAGMGVRASAAQHGVNFSTLSAAMKRRRCAAGEVSDRDRERFAAIAQHHRTTAGATWRSTAKHFGVSCTTVACAFRVHGISDGASR